MNDLSGKVAIVTGGASGIGLAITRALLGAGVHVVITSRRSELLSDTAAALSAEFDADCIGAAADARIKAEVQQVVEQAMQRFGGIHVLVNNSGLGVTDKVIDCPEENWDLVIDTCTKGTFLMCQAAVAAMAEGAAIINIASIAGREGYAEMAPYCASKFAVIGLTQALAAELAPRGIRVNAICPGVLGTAMWLEHLLPRIATPGGDNREKEEQFQEAMSASIPLGRPQTPSDIAGAARYLASAENVTGIELTVAGGLVQG